MSDSEQEAQRLRDTLARYGSQEHALKKALVELCELVENDRAPGVLYVEWHERWRDLAISLYNDETPDSAGASDASVVPSR